MKAAFNWLELARHLWSHLTFKLASSVKNRTLKRWLPVQIRPRAADKNYAHCRIRSLGARFLHLVSLYTFTKCALAAFLEIGSFTALVYVKHQLGEVWAQLEKPVYGFLSPSPSFTDTFTPFHRTLSPSTLFGVKLKGPKYFGNPCAPQGIPTLESGIVLSCEGGAGDP